MLRKNNVLEESIYVLAMTKSHRTTSEQELIRWDTAGGSSLAELCLEGILPYH